MQEILEAATIANNYFVLLSEHYMFFVARFMGICFLFRSQLLDLAEI